MSDANAPNPAPGAAPGAAQAATTTVGSSDTADSSSAPTEGRLTEVRGDYTRDIRLGPRNSLGRAPDNTIVLKDPALSRRHAEIHLTGDGHYEIIDLRSKLGTFVNRTPVQRQILADGAEIVVGSTRLRFTLAPKAQPGAQRWEERVPCELPVQLTTAEGELLHGTAADLSPSGVRVVLGHVLPIDTMVKLKMRFPRRLFAIRAIGRTVFVSPDGQSVGLALTYPTERQRNGLVTEYARLLKDVAP